MLVETRERRHYKISKKIELVQWITTTNCPIKEAARKFGVAPKTIGEWKHKFKNFHLSSKRGGWKVIQRGVRGSNIQGDEGT